MLITLQGRYYYPHFPGTDIEALCSGYTDSELQRHEFKSGLFDFTDLAPSLSIVVYQINKLIKELNSIYLTPAVCQFQLRF